MGFAKESTQHQHVLKSTADMRRGMSRFTELLTAPGSASTSSLPLPSVAPAVAASSSSASSAPAP
jgi:hypothetical protein